MMGGAAGKLGDMGGKNGKSLSGPYRLIRGQGIEGVTLTGNLMSLTLPLPLSPQIYPYEMLVVTNKGRTKLPPGVDRMRLEVCRGNVCGGPRGYDGVACPAWWGEPGASLIFPSALGQPHPGPLSHSCLCVSPLQRHLSAEDFSRVFSMSPEEFSKLALWKRNELKKKASLF